MQHKIFQSFARTIWAGLDLDPEFSHIINIKKTRKNWLLFWTISEKSKSIFWLKPQKNRFWANLVHFETFMWCLARFGTICTIKKNVKNTHGGVVFFTFFKLYKWYQIVQCTTYAHFGYLDSHSKKRERKMTLCKYPLISRDLSKHFCWPPIFMKDWVLRT